MLGWLLSGPISATLTKATFVNSITTRVLKAMHLDKFTANRDWINGIIKNTPKLEYLDRFEVLSNSITRKFISASASTSNTVGDYTRKKNYQPYKCIQDPYQEKRNYQTYKCIEEVDDWNEYKVQNSLPDRNINLNWFWELEHIGIIPEDREPSVWQDFEKKIKYIEELSRYEVELPCKIKLL